MDADRETEVGRQPENAIATLRESILLAFPAESYTGQVTPHDGESAEELDDDEELYNTLRGQRWIDVPKQLLERQPDGFVLLTDAAFVTFIAAWLMRALEDVDNKNEVRNFVVYSFCNNLRQYRLLNKEQRNVLRSLLEEFSKRGSSAYVKRLASDAVALIDWFLAREVKHGTPGTESH
jgi:hypothetical protein